MGTSNSKKVTPANLAVGFIAKTKVAVTPQGGAAAAEATAKTSSAEGAGSPQLPSPDDAMWGSQLASGEADSLMEHKGGLKGLKLRPDVAAVPSSSDEDEDDEITGETWLEKEEVVELEELKKQYNSNVLLDPEMNDLLERRDAVRGLKVVAQDAESDSDSDSDEDIAGDWLDEEAVEEEPMEAEEQIQVAVADLFEESTWTHMDALTVVFDRANLDKDQQERIISLLQEAEYEPGEYVCKQGEMGDKFFIITEGEVVITRELNPGEEPVVVTHLYQGHFFGETSLATEAPRNANVQAVRDKVRCMFLTKEHFTPLLESDEKFRAMIQELVRKKEETSRKRAELGKLRVGDAPEQKRNDVKISTLHRYARTNDGNLVINDYVRVKKLGAGAFGQVWLSLCLSDGRAYAMKIVDRKEFRKKTMRSDDDMLKEVAVMKRLQHRNVVLLYEVIDDPAHDKFYIVQEYMRGGVVQDDSELNEKIEVETAKGIFRDVLLGLDYLHFQGVIHRDIKPGNILLAKDGTAKLADFGSATLTDPAHGKLKGTDIQGTPAFMAPELFQDFKPGEEYSGFAVDIWAAGVTLYTMVVGVPPFMGDTEIQLVKKLRKEEPRVSPIIEANPHLKHLLKRMLDKNPETRITLLECIDHSWVTDEGSHPLQLAVHARLKLQSTAVKMDVARSPKGAVGGAGGVKAGNEAEETHDKVGELPESQGRQPLSEDSRVDSARDVVSELPTGLSMARSGIGSDLEGHELTLEADVVAVDDHGLDGVSEPDMTPEARNRQRRRSSDTGSRRLSKGSAGGGTAMRPTYSMSLGHLQSNHHESHNVSPANYNESIAKSRHIAKVKTGLDARRDLSGADKDRLVDRLKSEQFLGLNPGRAEVIITDAPGSKGKLRRASSDRQAPTGHLDGAAARPKAISLGGSARSDDAMEGLEAAKVDDTEGASEEDEDPAPLESPTHRTLSSKASLNRMGSLRRQGDFLMVTETVESGSTKALIIRSKSGKSFSSLGAKSTPAGSGGHPTPVSAEGGAGGASSSSIAESDEKPAGGSADSSTGSDDDDSDLSDIETLDNMDGGGAITEDLDNMFDTLMQPTTEDDPTLEALEAGVEARWQAARLSLKADGGATNEVLGIIVGHAEAQGDRASMEDRSIYFQDFCSVLAGVEGVSEEALKMPTALFGVYDGHNGSETAEFLKTKLHLNIARKPEFAEEDPTPAITAGCLETDGELYERSGEDISDPSGSTAIMLLMRAKEPGAPAMLYCANVGDSRCVLSRGGNALDLSVDHRSSRADEKERVEQAGGWIIKGRLHGVLAVTRSFGDLEHKGKHKERLWDKTFAGEPLTAEPEMARSCCQKTSLRSLLVTACGML